MQIVCLFWVEAYCYDWHWRKLTLPSFYVLKSKQFSGPEANVRGNNYILIVEDSRRLYYEILVRLELNICFFFFLFDTAKYF